MKPFWIAWRARTAMPGDSTPHAVESGHGLRVDRAAGDDPQGSGDARPVLFVGLLARARPQARVPLGFRQGVRARGVARGIIPEDYGGSGLGVTEAAILLHE